MKNMFDKLAFIKTKLLLYEGQCQENEKMLYINVTGKLQIKQQ